MINSWGPALDCLPKPCDYLTGRSNLYSASRGRATKRPTKFISVWTHSPCNTQDESCRLNWTEENLANELKQRTGRPEQDLLTAGPLGTMSIHGIPKTTGTSPGVFNFIVLRNISLSTL